MTPAPSTPPDTWLIHVFGGITLTTAEIIAFFALVLSVIALLRPWAKEHRAQRRASFSARIEIYTGPGQNRGAQERIVLKNHGPSRARAVEARFFCEGTEIQLPVSGPHNRTTSPLLHADEEHFINLVRSLADRFPDRVEIAWSDGRWGRQSQEFYPTIQDR